MNNVKNISIREFLARLRIVPAHEHAGYGMYLSPLRNETAPSFKVNYAKNLWYDFGSGEGGSIIDLVMRLEGCSVGEAIAKLENGSDFSFHRTQSVAPTQSSLRIVSIESLQNPNLLHYLQTKRCIDLDIAKMYCREIHYTIGEKQFYAIGFRSDQGGWELRNEYFKGGTSPKSPTAFVNDSPTSLLFEGFVDMLSYLTLKRTVRPVSDMVVLNSVHNLRRAEEFLNQHQIIHCFFDNDEAGKRAFAAVEKLGRETIDQSPFYRNHNDLNAYLCHKAQQIQVKKTK